LKNNDASLKGISKRCIDKRDPSTFARFLSSSTWNPFELNSRRLEYFQSLKQLRAIEKGIISLDDYISGKSGKKIKSAGWTYSHSKNKTVLGQNVVVLHYKDEKKEYGLNYSVYLNKKKSEKEGREFKTRLERASELIREIRSAGIKGQTIAMDSWFVTSDLISEITKLGYHWVGRIKSNRICFLDGQPLNVREFARDIPDDEWQETPLVYKTSKKRNPESTQYIASRIVDLKTLGKIKMVFVKETLEGAVKLFLGTDRLDLSAWGILKIYAERWRIETFFRDCKQNIDLSGYMGRTFIGFERFLCLIFIAYSFVKYLSLMGFWGRNRLKRGMTFGEELDNYHQLCFERFISVIHDVSSKIDDKSALIALFRHQFNNDKSLISNPLNDYMFYDLKSHILAAIG